MDANDHDSEPRTLFPSNGSISPTYFMLWSSICVLTLLGPPASASGPAVLPAQASVIVPEVQVCTTTPKPARPSCWKGPPAQLGVGFLGRLEKNLFFTLQFSLLMSETPISLLLIFPEHRTSVLLTYISQ